jgi:CheY-like chemotaxis protein
MRPDPELEEALERFIGAFELVFHEDWPYGRDLMVHNMDQIIPPDETFLRPNGDPHQVNWGSRAALLQAHERLTSRMREREMRPRPPSRDEYFVYSWEKPRWLTWLRGRLPRFLHPADLAAEGEHRERAGAEQTDPRRPPSRVLLVREASSSAAHLNTHLQRAGYETRLAVGVVEALQVMGWMDSATMGGETAWRPDAVVTDWKMASYDGLELLYLMRTAPELKEIPVVLIAATLPLYDTEAYLKSLPWQPDAYVFTPCTLPELVRTIETLLSAQDG